MRKYFSTLKYEFEDNTQYKISLLFNAVTFVIIVYIMMNIWNYLYSDPTEVIAGYSKQQMVWYVVVTELIWFCTRSFVLNYQISDDIRSGNIAYYVNKPYKYCLFIWFRYIGEIGIKFITYIPIGLFMGFIYLESFPDISMGKIICCLSTVILSTAINGVLRIIIDLSAFWIENVEPINWVYEKIILIIGTIFPIELFPLYIQKGLRFSPIYVISYGPARLFVSFDIHIFLQIFVAQLCYVFIGCIIISLIYKKGRKKIYVNGG